MGRTHLQDAVPMSLGSEFHGWRTTIGEEVERLANVRRILQCVNLGATAIGTTVTAAPGYPALATKYLSDITGIQFGLAEDLIEATSDAGDYVLLSGVIKHTAAKLTKICNDLRMLASGPHCGLNEINLLQMQPGSSIMAGNVWEWTTGLVSGALQDHELLLRSHQSPGRRTRTELRSQHAGREDSAQGDERRVVSLRADYCRRYRPAARMAQPIDTSTCHLGFRCVVREAEKG